MAVTFGGTTNDYVISLTGAPLPGGTFYVFTDAALTIPAALTNTAGAAIGNSVTAGASGLFTFKAPDGTGVLYTSDGAGGSVALIARTDLFTPTAGRVTPTLELYIGGDSIAFGKGQTADQKWYLSVASRTGLTSCFGTGQGGQTTSETALRAGALDIVTSASVTLPSGSTAAVTVPVATTGDWFADTYQFVGTLAGIPGILTHDAATEVRNGGTYSGDTRAATDPRFADGQPIVPRSAVWKFTPTSAPTAAVTVPQGATFHCTEADTHLGAAWVILVGTNNYQGSASNGLGTNVIRDLDLIVQRLEAAGNRRYVFYNTFVRPGDGADPNRSYYKPLNNAIGASRYGNHWIDWQGFLTGPGLAFEGLTPTTDDLNRIAQGQAPSSLIDSDGTHPAVPYGWDIIIELAVQAFARNGYVVGAKPVTTLALATSAAPTISAPTTTKLTVTPDVNTTAHGRHVQYRKTGATLVLDGPNTTGTTAVDLTGLQPGTDYDVRTVPVTILGYGTPSPWAQGTTTGTPPTILAADSFDSPNVNNINGRTLDNNPGGSGTRTWTTSNTFMGIVDNAAVEPDVSGRQTTALTDIGVSDSRVAVLLAALPSTGTNMSLFTRCTAAGSGYYALQISADGSVRVLANNGTASVVVSANGRPLVVPAGTAVAGDVWEIAVVGTSIVAVRNGAPVLTGTTDGTVAAGTKVGFNLARAASIASITVYDK